MSTKIVPRELLWIVITFTAVVGVFTMSFRTSKEEAEIINFKSDSIALVNSIRLSLVTASEAQNSAALANSEHDSREFSQAATEANAKVKQLANQVRGMVRQHGTKDQEQFLDGFLDSFAKFQSIDKQLRELSAENTNEQALELAAGAAAQLVNRFDKALETIAVSDANNNSVEVLRKVAVARVDIYRIQSMLMPHIIELENSKMDAIESDIQSIDNEISTCLINLNSKLPSEFALALSDAKAAYEEYVVVRHRIFELSRKNTDLRSAILATTEKRQAMIECQDILLKLESAIAKEARGSTIPTSRVGSR